MKGLKIFLYFMILSCFLCSCKKSSSEGTFIPPLPNDAEFEKHKASILVLDEEIRKNTNNQENYYKRAKIYFQLKNLTKSKNDLEAALSLNENDHRFRLLKSEILREEGKYQKALDEAKIAEILGSKSPETFTILGDLSQKLDQISEAKKYFKYVKEMAPYNGEVYYYAALLNIKEGDTTAAIDNYNLAKKLKPRFISTYKRLSEIYTNQGNTDLAKTLTIDLAKLYPNDAENCSILAKIYQRRKDIDSALIYYRKAITIKPNMFQASYDAGMLCLKNHIYTEAISFFQNTYNYAPRTPFINTSLGVCYENIGDKEKALEYYTIGFSVNKRDYKAIEGIKRLEEKLYYVEPTDVYEDILTQNKANSKKTVQDTTRIRLVEIQPKKLTTPKRDSVNSRLQNSNKFPIPIIK